MATCENDVFTIPYQVSILWGVWSFANQKDEKWYLTLFLICMSLMLMKLGIVPVFTNCFAFSVDGVFPSEPHKPVCSFLNERLVFIPLCLISPNFDKRPLALLRLLYLPGTADSVLHHLTSSGLEVFTLSSLRVLAFEDLDSSRTFSWF